MKALFFGLVATGTILFSTFAQASSPTSIEKVIGQCQMTKATIKKSKHEKTGSVATNETLIFTVTEVVDSTPEKPSYYDEVYMYVSGSDSKTCPTLGCERSPIAGKSYDNPSNAPMVSHLQVKQNDALKVDVVFLEDRNNWTRLTYDYNKGVGSFESRQKINDFGGILGVKTTHNEHYVREIRSCTFTAPVNFNPRQ